jgi:FlaA1/EpsC-like NDP-sugar epimerase
MFCPKCGKSEQQANTFCRNCGTFLPDFDKLERKIISPKEHFTANTALNIMTAVVSLALAITLYVMFLDKDDTPIVIYLTAGFLTAIFFWQAQVFWRTWLLKKQFPGLNRKNETSIIEKTPPFETTNTRELLNEADLSDVVPPSIVENTTKKLSQKINRKSS